MRSSDTFWGLQAIYTLDMTTVVTTPFTAELGSVIDVTIQNDTFYLVDFSNNLLVVDTALMSATVVAPLEAPFINALGTSPTLRRASKNSANNSGSIFHELLSESMNTGFAPT